MVRYHTIVSDPGALQRSLLVTRDTTIVLLVIDGLGGLADAEGGTELEEAATPNLDSLAAEGVTGLLEPVAAGVTPGSGPGHLALFGYDPMTFELGRGVLSAAGLGVQLQPGDVAARGNLCTLDVSGGLIDRRAGRIADEPARRLVDRLDAEVEVDGVEITFRHERQHRFLVVWRGPGLDPRVSDTDPQRTGVPPLEPVALDPAAERMASVASATIAAARRTLADEPVANGILLRGFDSQRSLPPFSERYGLRPAAVAAYPMYRGLASLLGFDILGTPSDLRSSVQLLVERWGQADFYFLHYKDADAAGEDGDRSGKIAAIERFDAVVPGILELGPTVLAVTGDHSTPSQLAAHSWHPVPLLVWSPWCGRDEVTRFGERWCRSGGLGLRRSVDLMPILLANAGRLAKYGA